MNVYHHRECIQNLLSHIEQEYLDLFYNRGDRKEGQENLRKIFQGKLISAFESFFFGYFFGLCFAFILLMWIITWSEDISVDQDDISRRIFPLFRGVGLLILYVWLLAWNAYVWTEYNINYKLIFNFGYHYSTVSEVRILFFFRKLRF
jgi:EXS family